VFKIETRKRREGWVRLGGSYSSQDEAWEKIQQYRRSDIMLNLKGQAPKFEYRIVRI